MSVTLNVDKLEERKQIVLNIKKEKGIADEKAEVVIVMDYSSSMTSMYNSGKVQQAVERLLPLGLAFDNDGEVNLYIFSDGVTKIGSVNKSNLAGYIDQNIWVKRGRSAAYEMGSTVYSAAINRIVTDYGGGLGTNHPKSFLKGLFGKKAEKTVKKMPLPVYVLFFTDGDDNSGDEADTIEALRNASHYGIFFAFVGMGDTGNKNFTFLRELDTLDNRELDNASFFILPKLEKATDDELYDMLLDEFPNWVPQARAKGMI